MRKLSDLDDDFLDLDEEDDYEDEIEPYYARRLSDRRLLVPIAAVAVTGVIIIVVAVLLLGGSRKKDTVQETMQPADETGAAPEPGAIEDEEIQEIASVMNERAGEMAEDTGNISSETDTLTDETGLANADGSLQAETNDPQNSNMSTDQGTEVNVTELLSSDSVAQTDQVTVGIDVARYQGTIDWEKLRNNGMIEKCPVRFVMIKATEGASRLDHRFADNFYQAREYGFIRGAYHFWSTRSTSEAQAAYFIKNVNLEEGDLPPVLDIEHKGKEQTAEDFKKSVKKWLDIVEEHYKVKPIIYTYYKFKMAYLSDSIFDEYPYWIAHYYVDKVEYTGKWKFWQHTDCGRLPGIEGYVDFNIYNGSFYDLRRLTIGYRDNDDDTY